MNQINVNIELGQKKLDALLEVYDIHTLLDIIGLRIQSWMDANFTNAGRGDADAPSGMAWAPLSSLTSFLRGEGAPLQNKGHLKQAFEVKTFYSEGRIVAGWPEQMQWLARILTEGTGPIYPVDKKALMIKGPAGAIFLHSTRGIPGRPMLPSLEVARRMIVDTLNAAFDRAVKRMQH